MVSPRRTPNHIHTSKIRPPTPRVKERSVGNTLKNRTVNVNSKEEQEGVVETSHNELSRKGTAVSNSLEILHSREGDVNSPPPKQQETMDAGGNEDIQVVVPHRLTHSDNLEEKEPLLLEYDSVESDKKIQTNSSQVNSAETGQANPANPKDLADGTNTEVSDNIAAAEKNESCVMIKPQVNQANSPASTEDSKLALDLIDGEINDDSIVDPIKLLQGAGEALKGGCRDHFDEGFHSGELMASDEEHIDEPKTENGLIKPDRAATPMPRTTYYRVVNHDPEVEKVMLMKEQLHSEKRLRELKRDSLMQKVRELHKKKAFTNDQARNEWRKRYMEVKKLTPRLEDHCAKLRQELERLVRELLVNVPSSETESKPQKPSRKMSYEIMIMRLLQELEDLRRRLESVSVRLNAEIKLRIQAEGEVKKLRKDLLQKKTQVTLTRKQTTFPRPQSFFVSAV